jgi:hypothetical protein
MEILNLEQNKKEARKRYKKELKEIKKRWEQLPDAPDPNSHTIGVSGLYIPGYKCEFKNEDDFINQYLDSEDSYLKHCYQTNCNEVYKLYKKTYYTVEDAIGINVEKHTEWFCKEHLKNLITKSQAKKKYMEGFPK